MKILIVNTFYYPNMAGGAEQSVKLLAEGLVKEGHEVAIYCVDGKHGKNENTNFNGVKVFRRTTKKFNLYRFSYDKKNVGKFEKLQQKLLCYYNRLSLKEFKQFCLEFKPDIVHTNTTYGLSPMIWKTVSKLKIPVIHTVRDIEIVSPVQYGHKANWFIRKAHRIYMRYATKFLDGVTAPSEYTLRTSLDIGAFKNAKIKKCIFNSVDIDTDELKKIIEEKSQRTSSKIKFMYAGRLIYFKGIKNMLEAFERINDFDCELHICGVGEMKEYVEGYAKKDSRIKYCGKLNNEQLKNKYIECDVLLVPSVWPEPFGRVVIEGNMYGMPVIAGNMGGIPEIIENMKGGILCDCNNTDEIVNAMMKLKNRSCYENFFYEIQNNIEIFSIDKQIKAFVEIYDKLV